MPLSGTGRVAKAARGYILEEGTRDKRAIRTHSALELRVRLLARAIPSNMTGIVTGSCHGYIPSNHTGNIAVIGHPEDPSRFSGNSGAPVNPWTGNSYAISNYLSIPSPITTHRYDLTRS